MALLKTYVTFFCLLKYVRCNAYTQDSWIGVKHYIALYTFGLLILFMFLFLGFMCDDLDFRGDPSSFQSSFIISNIFPLLG